MNKAFLVLGLLCFVNMAAAKCPYGRQTVGGVVVNPSGEVLEDALVEIAWREMPNSIVREEKTKANAEGRFAATLVFNTYSGATLEGYDACNWKLDEIKVTVSKNGFDTLTQVAKADGKLLNMRLSLKKIK